MEMEDIKRVITKTVKSINDYEKLIELQGDSCNEDERRIALQHITALLLNSPLHAKPREDKKNTYYMGEVGGLFDLYMDPYSIDHYVLVGYKSENSELGDAGLIFAPYMNTIHESVDSDTGKSVFFNTMRYDYISHPQDTTTGVSDSIFFKMFNIDMSDIPNLNSMDNSKR